MAKTKKRKTKKQQHLDKDVQSRLIAVVTLFIFVIAALKAGAAGNFIDGIFSYLLGVFAGAFYLICIVFCLYVIYEGQLPKLTGPKAIGLYLVLFAVLVFASSPGKNTAVGFEVFKLFQTNSLH